MDQSPADLFFEEARDIVEIEATSLDLRSMLDNVGARASRDSEVLSCVCDDQASQ